MKKHEFSGKDYTRAYRRRQSKIILKRRAQRWYHTNGSGPFIGREFNGRNSTSRGAFVDRVMKGKACTFLKWSAKPCSCYTCSYLKYDRIPKWKYLKNELDLL